MPVAGSPFIARPPGYPVPIPMGGSAGIPPLAAVWLEQQRVEAVRVFLF